MPTIRLNPEAPARCPGLWLHPVPEQLLAAAFGETRRVGKDSTISAESVRYSVPQ